MNDSLGITSPAASYTFSNLDGNGNPGQVLADEPLAPTVPSGSTSHTYNAPKNRLLTAGSETFTYDNEGQLATGYGAGYAFDYEHRLIGVGSAAAYSYDGIGNRLEATRNNVTTRYIYDLHGNLIAEADGANTITRYYIHGLGLLSLVTPAGTTYCYHFNQIGSTVALTDMTPEMVNQYAYTPFGTIANQTETIAQPFTFVGQMGVMTEPNGFYYMRARYYDPAVRRFISEDPIGFGGGDLNLYAYVGNNPILFSDPSGLWRTEDHPAQYRSEDTNWSTSPFNLFSGLGRHFRSREEIMPEIYEAIRKGDKEMFESRMHQMQDSYSHYDSGYRWYTLGHTFAFLLGEDPDDKLLNKNQYNLMLDRTKEMENLWNIINPKKGY